MRFHAARFAVLFAAMAMGTILFSHHTYAASRNLGKKHSSERQERKEMVCEEFSGFDIRESGTSLRNLERSGITISPQYILKRALQELGCALYDGAGKRRGIITVGISVKDRSSDGFLICTDTVNIALSWSRGNINAESFTRASLQDVPEPNEEALQKIVVRSLKDLRTVIARERRKKDPIAHMREIKY